MVVLRVQEEGARLPRPHVISVKPGDPVGRHVCEMIEKLRGEKPKLDAAKKWKVYTMRCGHAESLDTRASFADNGLQQGDLLVLKRGEFKPKTPSPKTLPLSTQRTPGGCSGQKKIFYFEHLRSDVCVSQNWRVNGAGTGSITWDAAFVLAAYVDKILATKCSGNFDTVVELGAGVGLPSVLAVHHGCKHVLSTDGDPAVLPLLEANMKAAQGAAKRPGTLHADTMLFRWDNEEARRRVTRNAKGNVLVLCADVLYRGSHKYWDALVDTLRALLHTSAPGVAKCLVAATERGGKDCVTAFLDKCRSHFDEYDCTLLVREVEPVEVACTLPQQTRIYELSFVERMHFDLRQLQALNAPQYHVDPWAVSRSDDGVVDDGEGEGIDT